jgi:hypothetical protein
MKESGSNDAEDQILGDFFESVDFKAIEREASSNIQHMFGQSGCHFGLKMMQYMRYDIDLGIHEAASQLSAANTTFTTTQRPLARRE